METLYEIVIEIPGEDDSVYFAKLTPDQAKEVEKAIKDINLECTVEAVEEKDMLSLEELMEVIESLDESEEGAEEPE